MEKGKNSFKPSENVTVEKGKLVVGTDEDTGITVCEKDCENCVFAEICDERPANKSQEVK